MCPTTAADSSSEVSSHALSQFDHPFTSSASLYKFLAVAGIAVFLSSMGFAFREFERYQDRLLTLNREEELTKYQFSIVQQKIELLVRKKDELFEQKEKTGLSIQLSRVLGVKKGFSFNEWNNRINRMSLDFLVCLKDSTVVAAVELDDKTHEKASRIEADAKKEKALSAAGITLVRWNVSALPDEAAIRQAFAK